MFLRLLRQTFIKCVKWVALSICVGVLAGISSWAFLESLRPGLSTGLQSVNLVVPHQTSLMGLKAFQLFGWPSEQIVETLHCFGNCVAASLPLTLYEAVVTNRLQRGDELLLIGTGAGLSIGGIILVY